MRLQLILALSLGLLAPRPARAEGNVTARVATEVSGYQDSVATSTVTPAVAVTVESPTAGWGATGRYLVDVVSAASPDIVATASPVWHEVRQAGGVSGSYKPGVFGVQGGGTFSYSNDYLSLNGGGQISLDLDEKNLTLLAGYSYGADTAGRTGTAFSLFSRKLQTHSITAGLTRTLSRSTLLSVGFDLMVDRGDPSKPYRYVPMFAPGAEGAVPRGASPDLVADTRIAARPLEQLPLARERYAVTARLANRSSVGTLRLEERLYTDSWSLKASTTDLRYYFDLSRRVALGPHARFHGQTAVSFWQRVYTATDAAHLPALRTGDRELGPLFYVGGGAALRLGLGPPAEPSRVLLTVGADGYWTSFLDALYVTDRLSVFGVVGLEAAF